MKLCWFHLMPYTQLPDDFREKHNCVWVDIDSRLFDPAQAHCMYNDFMDELEFAADMGGAARVQSVAGAGQLADLDEPGACAAAVSEFLG